MSLSSPKRVLAQSYCTRFFEEQIDAEALALDLALSSAVTHAEAVDYFPDMSAYNIGPDAYLEHIHRCKSVRARRSSRA